MVEITLGQKIFPNPGVVATQLVFPGLKYSWNDIDDYSQAKDQENSNNVNIWFDRSETLGK
ncbi:MAG: hypothetical protein O4861_10495 [Trichodesmium sp. St16_bin4-tuft]|nr:hypothetical protein [Trichodesmium sp. St4_bin8_1]MDE5070624.1 hypothetical protein [Trichodesmium sp. St5_bin8]MDE5092603.1 hypothetical protein [Trichodesmium sp. St18_bin3_1_1]MDE5098735.1 hypothetical protein [Trichodesmium sp. St16_bin4-tuft]MDE5103493.1 hypothetical protein [Trichodesmium sp. St19_bin2]